MIGSVLIGDCREGLEAILAAGIRARCCVTSPPYFGLRDYGTAKWQGGDAACDHVESEGLVTLNTSSTLGYSPGGKERGEKRRIGESNSTAERTKKQYRGACAKCGALRIYGQIGLEKTPAEYVSALVEVFRTVRDVLTDDGTLWLNLGDSYGAIGGNTAAGFNQRYSGTGGAGSKQDSMLDGMGGHKIDTGLRPKNLLGIPWRVAFALQADGWYLRQDIIWSKPNPMPESVRDRCTKAHEYLFLLSKSPRYYFDAEAIAEPCQSGESDIRKMKEQLPRIGGKHKTLVDPLSMASSTTNIGQKRSVGNGETRNRRSVWTVATQPFSEAHFATFPPALIEPCILAGSATGDVVLDPFMGAGTTALVAESLGRKWIGCELNPEYDAIRVNRVRQTGLAL